MAGRRHDGGIRGESAAAIADSVEARIRDGGLAPGDPLPTVRGLAETLGVSPATVAAAYRALRARGLVVTAGRRGTTVAARPPVAARPVAALPSGVRDLATGNPDPAFLPDLAPFLGRLSPRVVLYGDRPTDPGLVALAARRFRRHGLPEAPVTVVAGALDGIERVLVAHLRPGDRVAVEDPAFTGVLDLLGALGLAPVPVAVDDAGPDPDALGRALRGGCAAFVVTPRAQNPTGAALDDDRVRDLQRVLARHPDVLLVEDDHAGRAAGTPARTLVSRRSGRWASVHSVSKTLGPDLRVGVMTGDPTTVARVEGRQLLGMRWVSHLMQGLVALLWKDREVTARVREAGRVYTLRRRALLDALAAQGIRAHGRSGLNVWVPVREEAAVVQGMLDAGFAVAAGERFRLRSAPAVRITSARLDPRDAPAVAEALARVLRPARRSAHV